MISTFIPSSSSLVRLHYDSSYSSSHKIPKPAVFLDRDGVLIHDRHYLSSPSQIQLIDGCVQKLLHFQTLGYLLIVISNQSGISRGFFDWATYDLVTHSLISILNPVQLLAIYASGHHPSSESNWRKPGPLMFQHASNNFSIDLRRSLFIGDRLSDLIAARNACIPHFYHVKTGHGQKELPDINVYDTSHPSALCTTHYADSIASISLS